MCYNCYIIIEVNFMDNKNNDNKYNNDENKNTKNSAVIKINNTSYKLYTNESTKYIKGITKYINNKILEISDLYKNINNTPPFFLVLSINIADDLFKQRKLFAKNNKAIKENDFICQELKEKNASLRGELEAKNDAILEKTTIIDNLTKSLSNPDTTAIDNLYSENKELLAKINKLQDKVSENIILQDKLSLALSENDSLKDELASLKKLLDDTEEAKLEKEIEILDLQDEIENLKGKI